MKKLYMPDEVFRNYKSEDMSNEYSNKIFNGTHILDVSKTVSLSDSKLKEIVHDLHSLDYFDSLLNKLVSDSYFGPKIKQFSEDRTC